METYSIIKTVTKEDLDNLNHVNNVVYVKWIQDISKDHWQSVIDKMMDEYIWVVRRHDITYYGAAKLDDKVLITTAIKESKGPISYRQVVMKDQKTQKLLVKAMTEWCLLDSKTYKPIRVPQNIKNLFKVS